MNKASNCPCEMPKFSLACLDMPQLVAFITKRLTTVVAAVRFFSSMEPNMVIHVLQNLCSIVTRSALQPLV